MLRLSEHQRKDSLPLNHSPPEMYDSYDLSNPLEPLYKPFRFKGTLTMRSSKKLPVKTTKAKRTKEGVKSETLEAVSKPKKEKIELKLPNELEVWGIPDQPSTWRYVIYVDGYGPLNKRRVDFRTFKGKEPEYRTGAEWFAWLANDPNTVKIN